MSLDINNNAEDSRIVTIDEHQYKKNSTKNKNGCEIEDVIVPITVFNERKKLINKLVHFVF